MEFYQIHPTHKTPHVIVDLLSGEISISGRSIPENPIDFYQPLLNSLKLYISNIDAYVPLTIKFCLEYFNTMSAKTFVEIFKLLFDTNSKVIWYYDENDDDILEAGEDYKASLGNKLLFDIKIKPKEKNETE